MRVGERETETETETETGAETETETETGAETETETETGAETETETETETVAEKMIEVYEDLVTVIRISKVNSSHIIQVTLSHRQFCVSLPVLFSVCLYLFFSLSFCFSACLCL